MIFESGFPIEELRDRKLLEVQHVEDVWKKRLAEEGAKNSIRDSVYRIRRAWYEIFQGDRI